ncbi:MAG: hypothetical protein FWE65_03400 [Eggerthellaceae bacterium]|nr:hypothetical protein [Eggerthellaceae bacterium]
MAFEEERAYSDVLIKIRKTCSVLFTVLKICFIVFLAGWSILLLAYIYLLFFPVPSDISSSVGVSTLTRIFFFGLLTLALLRFTVLILKDMRNGEPPFTLIQSKRIRIMAYLVFTQAILDFLFSTDLIPLIFKNGFVQGFQAASTGEPVFFLNLGALVFAVILYCISISFEYGALLQQDKDAFI